MSFPAPTRRAHQKFCRSDEWHLVRNATGSVGHHFIYELALNDGTVLRTRISHPSNKSTYGASMWSHILRDQLDVTEEAFWVCVETGIRPIRGRTPEPANPIPPGVVRHLLTLVHLSHDEITTMTSEQAIERLNQYWQTGEK